MSSLTAIFGPITEKPAENERASAKLLDLYWNRAELKKGFADLRNEKFRLQERIKVQEGETARVQQKLDNLEELLRDPQWVYSIVTHFQLSALYENCSQKLATFAERLKQQKEDHAHKQLIDDCNARRQVERRNVEKQVGVQRQRVKMLEGQLQAERQAAAAMGIVQKFFRGRALSRQMGKIAGSIDEARADELSLLRKIKEIDKRPPPETCGLDIATKRAINFMILAYAQDLYLQLHQAGLVEKVQEAGKISVGAINYGARKECDRLVEKAAACLGTLPNIADRAGVLQQRARLIAENVVFSSADDPVPVSISVATIYDIKKDGSVTETDCNLLGHDYWGLALVVSR